MEYYVVMLKLRDGTTMCHKGGMAECWRYTWFGALACAAEYKRKNKIRAQRGWQLLAEPYAIVKVKPKEGFLWPISSGS